MRVETVIGDLEYKFCTSYRESLELAEKCRCIDPFLEEIAPSLLNKHDIIKYVSTTGLIYPFNIEQLKSASYEINIGNRAVYWDDNSKKHVLDTEQKESRITLKKNSITFVSLDTKFLLPFYIAVRFNLTITHVHRGILLGTGPLVDPGFCGELMVPLHNLTNNDYELSPGEPLIAVEFTKLTSDIILTKPETYNIGKKEVEKWYSKNIKEKGFDFDKYFKKALPLGIGKVESSLSDTLNEARVQIKGFERFKTASYLTFAATLVAVAGIIIAAMSMVADANKYVADAGMVIRKNEQNEYDLKGFATENELNSLREELRQTKTKLQGLLRNTSSFPASEVLSEQTLQKQNGTAPPAREVIIKSYKKNSDEQHKPN